MRNRRRTFAQALVFCSSASLMVFELVAGRMMAPFVGVSLFTWTAIIGAILGGVIFGNAAGGWMADRFSSRRFLSLALALAGGCIYVSPWLARLSGGWFARHPLPLAGMSLFFAMAVFFPAAFFLAMTSSHVVRWMCSGLESAGMNAGLVGAIGAIGSIVGTFLTGFIFLSYVGVHTLIASLAVFVIALALFVFFYPLDRSSV